MTKMQFDHPEYAQKVCVPFNIKIFSKEQITVLIKSFDRSKLPIIYFDATGSIVRTPLLVSKRVYLYTAVLRIKTSRIFPIFEMISANHYSKTNFKIFHDFRTFLEEKNSWPAFGAVVTDFGKANNKMTLLEYIDECYEIITNKKKRRRVFNNNSFVLLPLHKNIFRKNRQQL